MSRAVSLVLGAILLAALPAAVLHAGAPAGSSSKAENTFAICGCGAIFVPDANTKYLAYEGKSYACCTEACHAMAAKDPAKAAAMGKKVVARRLNQLSRLQLNVANVIAVDESGTQALCGCGKKFMVGKATEFLVHESRLYACCTHECHELAAQDPAAAQKMFEDQLTRMN